MTLRRLAITARLRGLALAAVVIIRGAVTADLLKRLARR